MKYHLFGSSIWLLLFFFGSSLHLFSQNIWFEDFQSYADDSGYNGLGTTGDYPSLVSKWSLDITGAELAGSSNWYMVNKLYSDYHFETKNTKGECIWTSESITISNHFDVQIQVHCSEVGDLEDDDYIKVYYSLDGGPETLFSCNGEAYENFTEIIASQSFLSGSTLQIIVKTKTNYATEKIRFDDITVSGISNSVSLMFTEIADPSDDSSARFIELKNVSSSSIDFDVNTYYISRQIDGEICEEFQLTGSICSGCIRVVANNNSNFNSAYSFSPGYSSSVVNGDGNDAYIIYSGGDHNTGVIVDIYGQIGQDGTDQTWNYENSRAVRNTKVGGGVSTWDNSEWTISTAAISTMTPGALENEYRFYNSIWHPGLFEPTSSSDNQDVVIQSGSKTISTSFDCFNLSVYTGSTLELSEGTGITVSGAIRNDGLLKIKSDSVSSASMITSTSYSFNLQYDLYVSGGITTPWHLISSPVKNQSINAFVTNSNNNIQTSNTTQNYALALFNTSTDVWNYYHNGAGTNPNISASAAADFVMASGYSMLRSTSGEVSFAGEYVTESQSIYLAADKWNLVGNPYPNFLMINSLVYANNILTSNTTSLNDAYEAIYLWDPITEKYKIINQISSSSYLSPGQGFFVLADSDGGDFLFDESMQSHQSGDWFERIAVEFPRINLVADFEASQSNTEINYIDGTSIGLDLGYDAGRFTGGDNQYFISSKLMDSSMFELDLALQCIPSFNEGNLIPINVFAIDETQITFSLELENFPEDTLVFIEDVLIGSYTRLDVEGSSYTTIVNELTNNSERFFLHMQSSTIGIEHLDENSISIFTSNQGQVLNIIGADHEKTSFRLFDLLGRNVFQSELIKSNQFSLPTLPKGIYIIQLFNGERTLIKKIKYNVYEKVK